MSKHLHFDSVGGASGDMILGALIDLGLEPDALRCGMAGLMPDVFEIETQKVLERALRGTRVHVRVGDGHADDHHGHAHNHKHPPHRGLSAINALIENSSLAHSVKARSKLVFRRLAEAEARVHGTTPEDVHFHEVGAVDAIVDIVGACLGLELLGVDSVSVAPLPLGHGVINSAHGLLPVPAPATVELLKGFAVAQDDEPFELVTPTGAALLTTWSNGASLPSGLRLVASGCGVGHRVLQHRPNLLRALLLEGVADLATPDQALVMECNLDDMNPELTGALMERLLAAGALDVFLTPVQMKKQRPGVLLTVLCVPELRSVILELVFRESTTFGVREYYVRRTVLERRMANVQTVYGPVGVKIGRWNGVEITCSPEYDDCLRLARKTGVPLREIYDAALGLHRPVNAKS